MSRSSLLVRVRQVASPRKTTKTRMERVQKINKVSKSLFGPVIKSEFRRWVCDDGIELISHFCDDHLDLRLRVCPNDSFIDSPLSHLRSPIQIRSVGNGQISITSVAQVELWLHQGIANYTCKQSISVGNIDTECYAEILSSHLPPNEINASTVHDGRERPFSII